MVFKYSHITNAKWEKYQVFFAKKLNKARNNFKATIKFEDRHYVSGGEKVLNDEENLRILR